MHLTVVLFCVYLFIIDSFCIEVDKNETLYTSQPEKFDVGNNKLLKLNFYERKEFVDFLKEHRLKINVSSLPAISEVMSMLGTDSEQETMEILKEIASTKQGIEFIKSYLASNFNIKIENSINPNELAEYPPSITTQQSESLWDKALNWFGLSQSTKIDSLKNDLNNLKTVVPVSNQATKRVMYVWKFLKPVYRSSVPISPPIRPQSDTMKSANFELPVIRLTEEQFNAFMNNEARKYLIKDKPTQLSPVKRNFKAGTFPVRVSQHSIETGAVFKADPQDISKVTKHLSEN